MFFAMFLKVDASIGPVSGALFIAGAVKAVCADDAGVRSSLEAMTIPTASDETAISRA
jgi:hypothetical protein